MSFFNKTFENLPKNGVTNVYGHHGSGKTFFFSQMKHVKFDHDILRTKESTTHFIDMMKCSKLPLILDDYDIIDSLPGVKELKPLKIPFYIISENKLSLDIITNYFQFPKVPVEEFAKCNGLDIERAEELVKKANGNMTLVKTDLDSFKSFRDVFMDSKDYVKCLIESDSVSQYVHKHLNEHGNTLGIIHENYPDFSDDFVNITQSLSDAQLIDDKIYSDVQWDLMPFFNVSACLIPSLYMNGTPDDLRPGSIWTKQSNMYMRMSRLKRLRVPREHIFLWSLKANSGEILTNFDSYDLDSINQLSFTKIKPKVLTSLKKHVKNQGN